MNKLILMSLFTIATISISAEQEVFKSCVSGEREPSAKEANSFACIESDNPNLSKWCAKMAEGNSLTKKYKSSGKSCLDLGFTSKPVKMPLGNSYTCNFALPKFNECKDSTKQILLQTIQF
ncbi:MAG TPA: hypothetical protein PK079_03135 [Leptospiraceae bacterium]|nr:hypothetical protein [Leptospiraceae bacterium]HMW04414.1 hypothetical protein [Leptospiraceae bacterium]HMX31542.1 hypothetical protein [Leptospiraceae bacterium]HMY30600.1 hypothetical protein [Leptospiraceae bacterium]HMZ64458.1 hypothetical protein [Leptospiraceae bacterium]